MTTKKSGFSVNLAEYMTNAVSVASAEEDGKFIYVNPTWEKMTGYSSEEAYNMSYMDLVHPEMREFVTKLAKAAMEGAVEPEHHERKVITKDGKTGWAEFFIRKIDYCGKPAFLTVANDISDRKFMEIELMENRQMLRAAQRIAHVGSLDLDLQTGTTNCSNELYRMMSLKPKSGDFSLKEFTKKIHPDDRKIFLSHFKDSIKNKKFDELHFRIIRPDETHRFVKSSGEISCDESGTPVKLIAILHDITDLKEIELKSRENADKLKSILRVVPIGIGVVVNRVFVDVNDRIYQITGYSKGELIGKNARIIYPSKKEYDRVGKDKYAQIEKSGTGIIETQWKTKKGKIIDILLSSTAIDKKDLTKGVTFTALDITDRKQARRELEKNEELFRSLYENASIGIYRTTPDGKILMANPAAVRMLGFKSFKELSKRNLQKLGFELSYSRQDFLDRFKNKDVVIGMESTWIKKDGKPVYVRESARAIRDKNKKILYFDGTFEDITDSKESEEKLKSSEARMHHLLTSTSTVVYSLHIENGNRVPVWVGDNITQFGYSTIDVMKKNWWKDNVHPEDYDRTVSSMKNLIESQHTIIEYRFKHKSGHFIWLRDEMVFIPDMKRKTSGEIVGSWINITKRKTVEEALRHSEESYRLLVENLSDSIFSLDEKGIIKYMSPAGERIFDQKISEIIDKPLSKFVYPEDLSEWKLKFKKIISGDSGSCDYRILTKDKAIRHVRSSCRPVYTNNHLTSITGIMTDITVQKRNEEEINKLSRAVEQSPSSVIITDINGNIEYVNNKLTEVVGYNREELIGVNARIFKSGHMENSVYEELWSTILSGKNWHGELKNKRKDGTIILEDVIISPIKNNKGTITHFVGLREDVTQQRLLEEQLRQSQKMEAIGHLAGGVAHDFNNLLTVISGYSDLILRDIPKDHRHFEKLYQVKLSGQRAEGLTRQLLAFSRKQIMKPVVLDINSLISEMEKMLKRIIGEDIDLMTAYAKDLLRVKADPGQIEQVILNLVVNSRDAMPNGGKLIIETKNILLDSEYISYHPEAKTGMHTVISVSDTGTGISEQIQTQIYEPFFSTKEKGKGTGLGLSTVYGIVMQSGGHIDMSSEPNIMTTFNIYLPSLKENALTKEEQSNQNIDQGKKETILIVEDEDTVRQFILAVLNKYNFNVIVAKDSKDALRIVKTYKKKIHLLLTDVIMPGMSGKILSEEISKILPKIKIIFMSGYTDDAIVQHGVLEDGINFIQKPFTPQSLIKQIKEVLRKKN